MGRGSGEGQSDRQSGSVAGVDVSQPQSTEEALRGGDSRIHACLLVETLREEGCRLVEEQLAKDLGVPLGGAASFRLLCELSNG